MTDHQIKVISSFQELEEVQQLWKGTQWHPNAEFDFFKLIASSRPEVIAPCVFAVSDHGKLVSLLAGRIERAKMTFRLGYANLAKIQVLRLVIIEGAFMGDRSEGVWVHLLSFLDNFLVTRGLDYAYFEQMRIASEFEEKAKQLLSPSRFHPAHDLSEHWLMQLPKTWDEFLKSRSKKHRYWLKRLENILNKEFPGQWTMRRYSTSAEATEFAVAAETVASTTYHRSLGVGFAFNNENSTRLELEAKSGRLRGYVLSINGEPAAFWYCTTFLKRLYLCSTGYLPAFRSYEVGTVLLMKVFQDHCGSEVDVVDFGLGEAGYKQRFGSEHFTEASYTLFAGSGRGRRLNAAHRLMRRVTRTAKRVLDRLKITQRFKTLWRRRLEQSTGTAPGPDQAISSNAAADPAGGTDASHEA